MKRNMLNLYTPKGMSLTVEDINRKIMLFNKGQEILTLDDNLMANFTLVAELYEVDEKEIINIFEDLKDEFMPDTWINGYNDSYLFSRRAIIRFGLLLTESEVAA